MRKRKEGYKNAHYRNIPAYFNVEESSIEGRNWFYDILIDINLWIDVNLFGVEDFPIWIDVEDDEDEQSV